MEDAAKRHESEGPGSLDEWIWGLRRQVSLLLANGHADAPDYPVAFIWEETQLIVERDNQMLANHGTMLNAAVSTGIAAFGKDGGRKAQAAFTRMVKKLAGDKPTKRPRRRRREGEERKDRVEDGR